MTIKIPQVYSDLFKPARYKAYYGGRGGGKSHSFASALVIKASEKPLRILCGREIQKSIKDSVKRLIDDKIQEYGLNSIYESTETEIRGNNGSLFLFAGVKSNPEAIKSMEGIDIAWIEEANKVSRRSLDLLIPTIRKENSEIWFSWNPENETDPVDVMFRGKNIPPDAIIKKVNYYDNPFFPEVLKKEAEFDRKTDIEKYNHIWEGGYIKIVEGAYYARALANASIDGRVTRVRHDSSALVYASFDLGISDSTSVWLAQFIGNEVHLLEYFENSGEGIEWYAKELKNRNYNYAPLILPHDARARQLGTGKSIEEVLQSLGFETQITPMIPVKDGIEDVRRMLERSWFDIDSCREGLHHLRSYRENYDEKLRISRGPLHDEHSHCADSLRYMAISRQTPTNTDKEYQEAATNYIQQIGLKGWEPDPKDFF